MQDIIQIANKIKANGGNIYLVGGAVRDKILKQEIQDYDYCVTGLTQEEFCNLFPEAQKRGKFFSVFDLKGYEIALARKEYKTGIGHKQFQIKTGKEITIQEDLTRRDITINAIAQDVLTGKIIDPFHGKQDIENKIIRATTNAFGEDPLRVYRVARFASTLQFLVEENTIKLMNSLKEELITLPKERIYEELKKAIMSTKPSMFFEILKKANVLDVHFKEINDLIGIPQPIQYHPEGDVFCHTMLALDKSAKLTNQLEIRYAVLVHDLGKASTPKEILPHHYGHDKNGIILVKNLSNRIGVPKKWEKTGLIASIEHMRAGKFLQMKPAKQVNFIEKIDKSVLGLEGMEIVIQCDYTNRQKNNNFNFAKIGNELIKQVNGKLIKANYKEVKGVKFKKKLREERIKWIKNNL